MSSADLLTSSHEWWRFSDKNRSSIINVAINSSYQEKTKKDSDISVHVSQTVKQQLNKLKQNLHILQC